MTKSLLETIKEIESKVHKLIEEMFRQFILVWNYKKESLDELLF